MNVYGLILLCASAISVSLGLSVYYLNRKATLNKLFMLLMAANAYWAFCRFMQSQAPTIEGAVFWEKALFLWPFLVVLMLHFTLVFTESGLLKNKLIYIALYFPATLFALIDLTTGLISGTPTLQSWGYTASIPSDSMVVRINGVWAAVIALLLLFFFASYYNRVIDKTKKQQTKFVALGFAIPTVTALLTDSILPSIGVTLPVLGPIAGSITSVFVVYATVKYELFSFRPEIAAENVFSTMPDAVILASLRGTVIKVNRSFVELMGYSESEVVGSSISQIIQKAGVQSRGSTTPQIMANLKRDRELRNYEITFHTKAEEKKTGMISCSMVTDNNGQDVGAAFVLHDITERKEMEQKLLRSERFASIGELAGMLGHDLRNPLSGIRNAAFYLKRKHADRLDIEDQVMFESIDKSIDYSNKIINDLLDYSSEIRLELTSVTPKTLVHDSLSLLPQPQNVKIIDEIEETPEFQVDVVKICRGFVNILKNAFDAMPDGGELHLKSEKVGETIVFTFDDTGAGITKEALAKLWTPLFTTKAKGMGFGLAICKRNVEAHGGKITVKSTLGNGTKVKVELPIKLDGRKLEISATP